MGYIDEQMWKNSAPRTDDLNNNGNSDDKFYFITFKSSEFNDWVVYFDLDGDGNIETKQPIRNYKINFDSFTFEVDTLQTSVNFCAKYFSSRKQSSFSL